MAIFHYDMGERVSRGSGKGAVASAAYLCRERYRDERTGEVHDYRARERRSEIAEASAYIARSGRHDERQAPIFVGLYGPKEAPDWCRGEENIERFWNEAEKAERHPRAQIAERVIIALPHELSLEENRWLVQDHIRDFTRQGRVVQVAIHAPDHDRRNVHAHLLISTRGVNERGFNEFKTRDQQQRYLHRSEYVSDLRERWERIANRHLERHGHEVRIDRRALSERGIDREPNLHLGPAAAAKERQGERSVLGDRSRAIEARNAEREQAKREIAGLERDVAAIDRAVREREKTRQWGASPAPFETPRAPDREKEARDYSQRLTAEREGIRPREATEDPQRARLRALDREALEREASLDQTAIAGWYSRPARVGDIVREMSPAYARAADRLAGLQQEGKDAERLRWHYKGEYENHTAAADRRWQDLGLVKRFGHRLGLWTDRVVVGLNETAERARLKLGELAEQERNRSTMVGRAEHGANEALERWRPQAERELGARQERASVAREVLHERQEAERLKERERERSRLDRNRGLGLER